MLALLNSMQYLFISHTIGPTDFLQPSPAPHFKPFQALLIHFPKCPGFITIQSYTPMWPFTSYFITFKSNMMVKRVFNLLNAALLWQSCTICYHAAQIAEIFHILRGYFICQNVYCGWLPWDSQNLSLPPIPPPPPHPFPFHSIFHFQLLYNHACHSQIHAHSTGVLISP
jgi:hypothetical protein